MNCKARASGYNPVSMGSGDNQGLYFIGAGFAVLFLVLILPKLLRRRSGSSGPRPGTFAEPGTDLKAELERLLAEIREASREELARLDTQMRRLDHLRAECDRKAKELEALLGRAPAGAEPARPADPLHDRVYALQDSGRDVAGICADTGLEKGEVELILGLRRVPPMKPAPKSGPPSDR
jgi:hypothetical protein